MPAIKKGLQMQAFFINRMVNVDITDQMTC